MKKEGIKVEKNNQTSNFWGYYHKAVRSADIQKLRKLLRTVYRNLKKSPNDIALRLLANAIERDLVLTPWEIA